MDPDRFHEEGILSSQDNFDAPLVADQKTLQNLQNFRSKSPNEIVLPFGDRNGTAPPPGRKPATPKGRRKKVRVDEDAELPEDIDDDEKKSRYDNSLALLTRKFVGLIMNAQDGILNLNDAAELLHVQKRRIYDITNVLEGIGLIQKKAKNNISWLGVRQQDPPPPQDAQDEINRLKREERVLDNEIRELQAKINTLIETDPFAGISHEDLRSLPFLKDQTLLVVKAPPGTRLEVPDSEEGGDPSKRRYQVYLKNEDHAEIDVHILTQDEGLNPVRQSPERPVNPEYFLALVATDQGLAELYDDHGLPPVQLLPDPPLRPS